METTGIIINDEITVRVGDEFVNPKGSRMIVEGFTKTNRVRFTFVHHLNHYSPKVYTRTPDAFLGHIRRELWTCSGGN